MWYPGMIDRKFVGGVLALALLAPMVAHSENTFPLNYVDLEYSRIDPDMGDSLTGVSGRINIALSEQTWIGLIREDFAREAFDQTEAFGMEYSALMFGAGDHITDTGMWYLEAGPTFSRISGGEVRRSIAFGFGIRTQISPRFELGGGPRFGAVNRLNPEKNEPLMRLHWALSLSDSVAATGSYDYREDGSQWRFGARISW